MFLKTIQNEQDYYKAVPHCNESTNPNLSSKAILKEEIEETYELLRDFGINIKKSSIPRNISIFDLHMWRKKKIKEYLFS